MHKLIKITLAAALPVVWAAGCSDFLKGGELTNNPNNAVLGSATNDQLFIPIQVNQVAQQNSEAAWAIAQWLQSLIGFGRQQLGVYQYANAQLGTGGFDNDWNTVYTGGGLTDLRVLEAQALTGTAAPDHKYNGIALIMEGWMMGNAADWWGDIPYNEADNFFVYPTPTLDAQAQVYDSVIAKLDRGISEIRAGGVGSIGPSNGVDLVYNGDSTKWIQLAHTLKARFMLHEVLAGGATYAQVLTEANAGISTNDNDYIASWFIDGIQNSSNNWWQEMDLNGGTGRNGDIIAGIATVSPGGIHTDTAKIVKILRAASDPRLGEYFDALNDAEAFMTSYRLAAGYPQPLVTYNENLLIKAEATLHTAGAAAALPILNLEQTAWATATAWHNALTVPASGVANDSTIGTEKYITLFQNVESWNDWKRLCVPKLLPVAANPTFGNAVPARILYQITEQQTNPNIPAVGVSPNGSWNWNDTRHGCTL